MSNQLSSNIIDKDEFVLIVSDSSSSNFEAVSSISVEIELTVFRIIARLGNLKITDAEYYGSLIGLTLLKEISPQKISNLKVVNDNYSVRKSFKEVVDGKKILKLETELILKLILKKLEIKNRLIITEPKLSKETKRHHLCHKASNRALGRYQKNLSLFNKDKTLLKTQYNWYELNLEQHLVSKFNPEEKLSFLFEEVRKVLKFKSQNEQQAKQIQL